MLDVQKATSFFVTQGKDKTQTMALLYYAQAYWLAATNKKLLDEQFMRLEDQLIPYDAFRRFSEPRNVSEIPYPSRLFLEMICDTFPQDAATLMGRLRREDPWVHTKNGDQITVGSMRIYFEKDPTVKIFLDSYLEKLLNWTAGDLSEYRVLLTEEDLSTTGRSFFESAIRVLHHTDVLTFLFFSFTSLGSKQRRLESFRCRTQYSIIIIMTPLVREISCTCRPRIVHYVPRTVHLAPRQYAFFFFFLSPSALYCAFLRRARCSRKSLSNIRRSMNCAIRSNHQKRGS